MYYKNNDKNNFIVIQNFIVKIFCMVGVMKTCMYVLILIFFLIKKFTLHKSFIQQKIRKSTWKKSKKPMTTLKKIRCDHFDPGNLSFRFNWCSSFHLWSERPIHHSWIKVCQCTTRQPIRFSWRRLQLLYRELWSSRRRRWCVTMNAFTLF